MQEYAHGDPRKERKVVLNEHALPHIRQTGNLRVVSRRDLLECFVKTVED